MRNKLKQLLDPTLFRFLLVGVVNTAVGYGIMFGLYNLAGLHTWGDLGYWISSAANYLVGSVVSFFLNKRFTFRNQERGAGVVLRFAVNITVCWALAYGLAAVRNRVESTAPGQPVHAGGLRPVRSAQLLRPTLFRLPQPVDQASKESPPSAPFGCFLNPALFPARWAFFLSLQPLVVKLYPTFGCAAGPFLLSFSLRKGHGPAPVCPRADANRRSFPWNFNSGSMS